jgi:hypothetical protein
VGELAEPLCSNHDITDGTGMAVKYGMFFLAMYNN